MDRDEIVDHGPDADGREDEGHEEVEPQPEDEGDGEDLLDDNMWDDYRAMPQLDKYDEDGLDDAAEDGDEELSEGAREAARQAAEDALDRRDRREHGALPGAFDDDDSMEPSDGGVRRRRAEAAQARGADQFDSYATGSDMQVPIVLDADSVKGPLKEWVAGAAVANSIKASFRAFLESYAEEEGKMPMYQERIVEMVQANKQTLEVDFIQLSKHQTALAIWAIDAPAQMFELFSEVAKESVDEKFPKYVEHVHSEIFVRMTGLPVVEPVRNIRHSHLNTLVRVHGVVTRRTGVFPQLALLYYGCGQCGATIGPLTQSGDSAYEVKPMQCPECQGKGPFTMDQQQTVYRNYQKITLQESPGSVPAGRLPRSKNVVLLHDLIDIARPGEEIDVTGIFQHGYDSRLNAQTGFPVFATFIEANNVKRRADDFSLANITEDDLAAIQKLSRDKTAGERIIDSIAPSIYGHRNIKAAIAMALFGGQEKHVGSHRLRGDINVLLIGDPGTAKSQFLKYVEKTSTRAVYTTGKGASAVGLTATVAKDPITHEWTLEGGALVLADRGICLIDEFDKMNENDRVSIHEAMEQQSISISKAGIVTALQARCSVIAAANPDNGRYDPSRTFNENVRTLTDPIISRFDCLCVVKDTVDAALDERLAKFVVESHHNSHPANTMDELERAAAGAAAPAAPWQADNLVEQPLLKLYIAYAKRHCHPKLQDADTEKMVQVYTELRKEAGMTHAMPVAVRHLESMIRMSEAYARMHLRDAVEPQDIDIAIRLMLESFVSAQKYSVQKQLRRRFQRFMAERGDYNNLLLTILRNMVRDAERAAALVAGGIAAAGVAVSVDKERFEERAQEYQINDVDAFYRSTLFSEHRFAVDEAAARIVMAR